MFEGYLIQDRILKSKMESLLTIDCKSGFFIKFILKASKDCIQKHVQNSTKHLLKSLHKAISFLSLSLDLALHLPVILTVSPDSLLWEPNHKHSLNTIVLTRVNKITSSSSGPSSWSVSFRFFLCSSISLNILNR